MTGTGTGPSYIYYSGFISHKESHAMIDFTVGQDVGLGMFGQQGSSILRTWLCFYIALPLTSLSNRISEFLLACIVIGFGR